METYIITFENGTHYKTNELTENDYVFLSDGLITIIRQSDLKELNTDLEWVELEKWINC